MIRQHRILIIGRHGQLARALAAAEWPSLTSLHFAGRAEIDLFHPLRLRQQISALNPEIIINAAGYARVDGAEQEPEAAYSLNTVAVDNLATAATMLDLPLIQISTAHVFSGDRELPYRENDRTEPSTIYGQTMLAGETAIRRARGRFVILRTSRLFSLHGDNFLKTLLALGRTTDALELSTTGYACPTPADALANIVPHIAIAMIEGRRFPAVLHYAGETSASWYEIGSEVFALAGKFQPAPVVAPLATLSLDGKPAVSTNLALDCSLAHGLGLPTLNWRLHLPEMVKALCEHDAAEHHGTISAASPLRAAVQVA